MADNNNIITYLRADILMLEMLLVVLMTEESRAADSEKLYLQKRWRAVATFAEQYEHSGSDPDHAVLANLVKQRIQMFFTRHFQPRD